MTDKCPPSRKKECRDRGKLCDPASGKCVARDGNRGKKLVSNAHDAARVMSHVATRNVIDSLGMHARRLGAYENLERGFRGTSLHDELSPATKALELVDILDNFGNEDRAPAAMARIAEYVRTRAVDPRKIKNARGKTLLMYAAHYDDPSLVNALIRGKVNVNAADIDGWTALIHHAFSTHRHPNGSVARRLINAGASVNPAHGSPLIFAVANSHVKLAKVLIDAGANVNYVDAGMLNWTPLITAAADGNVSMVIVLLKAGARVHDVDVHGNSALDLADDSIPKGRAIAALLRTAGAA